jgi:hypothetical protein
VPAAATSAMPTMTLRSPSAGVPGAPDPPSVSRAVRG